MEIEELRDYIVNAPTKVGTLDEFEMHKMTAMNPKMNTEEFAAFVTSMRQGQLIPVMVYRGKIVDGYHRHSALTVLGTKTIKYIELPRNAKLADIQSIVVTVEVRRHQTPTQLAIKAFNLTKKAGGDLTQEAAARLIGVCINQIERVATIFNAGRLDIIELLRDGGKFPIPKVSDSGANYSVDTSSLAAVAKFVKGDQPKHTVDWEKINYSIKAPRSSSDWITAMVDAVKYSNQPSDIIIKASAEIASLVV